MDTQGPMAFGVSDIRLRNKHRKHEEIVFDWAETFWKINKIKDHFHTGCWVHFSHLLYFYLFFVLYYDVMWQQGKVKLSCYICNVSSQAICFIWSLWKEMVGNEDSHFEVAVKSLGGPLFSNKSIFTLESGRGK